MSPAPEGRQSWLGDAPASSLILPVVLVAAFGLQFAAPFVSGWTDDQVISELGLSGAALRFGRWWTLLSYMFVHAGLMHIAMNTSVALAMAGPTARALGGGLGGLLRFFAFFLVCGVLAGLTAVAVHPGGAIPLVGASGAISGLWGASTRVDPRGGPLLSAWRRDAWAQYTPFLLINVVLMAALTRVGLPISWEAHLGGFVSGLLLLDLFVARPRAAAGPGARP